MPRVTISYRRDDSAGIARLIFERLRPRYGADSVFMDIDAIEFGEDYRDRIDDALRKTDYLLVLIGPRWLGPTTNGKNRISDANDPVRVEIERALEIGIRTVPVLIEDTPMPGPDELPATLARLAYLNAAPITVGREFDTQMERIIRFIDRTYAEVEARRAADAEERRAKLESDARERELRESNEREEAQRREAAAAAAAAAAATEIEARRAREAAEQAQRERALREEAERAEAARAEAARVEAARAAEASAKRSAAVVSVPEAVAESTLPRSGSFSLRTILAIAGGVAGVFVVILLARAFMSSNGTATAPQTAIATHAPASPTALPGASIPARSGHPAPAGFVVMYERLPGVFSKIASCVQTGSNARAGIRVFNDYREPLFTDLALTKRADHPGDHDWLPSRQHFTGMSPEIAFTIAAYKCGASPLFAGLRHARFAHDTGPYIAL